jgi:RHS repeat-associated protein
MRRFLTGLAASLLVLCPVTADAQETCGDLVDNDSDGLTDEQCNPAAVTGVCESPISCGTTGAVAPRTGQLVYNEPADIAPRVPFGPPLALGRNYGSLAATQSGYLGSLGKGWRHSFMGWLDPSTAETDEVIVRLTSGQEALFAFDDELSTSEYDVFAPQPGYHVDTLRRDTTTDVWQLITLEGWTYEYDDSSCGGLRMLVRIEDEFGQGLALDYDGSCYLTTVTDADGERELRFTYASTKLDKVDYYLDGTLRLTVQYTVTSDKLEDVTVGSTLIRDYTWNGDDELDLIEDGDAKDVADFAYLDGTGKTAQIKTGDGSLGYEYGNTDCDGGEGVYVYYNDTDDTDTGCDSHADCPGDNLCGGESTPGTGNTGVCYRARRCVALSSSHDDLVDSVTSECTTCVDTKAYVWDTTPGIDLIATHDAEDTRTTFLRNADGLVIRMVENDDNDDADDIPASGARVTYYTYHSAYRGRLTEVRRMTELVGPQGQADCDHDTDTQCKRTLYIWDGAGGNGAVLDRIEEIGFTYEWNSGSPQPVQYFYTTEYTFDEVGRLEQIDGPRTGYDQINFAYWVSSDPLKDAMLREVSRELGASSSLTATYDDYDYWGNAKSIQDPTGNFTCRTFHADLDVPTVNRVAMNNQTSCATSNSADLLTTTTYDTAKRVTKIERPLGNCIHRAYDDLGRLHLVRERDDCTVGSGGNTMELTYNDDGLVTKTEYLDASNTVTYRRSTTYGVDRRLYEIINPTQTTKKKTLTYHADGMLAGLTGEEGVGETEWTYDPLNRATLEMRHIDSSNSDDWTIDNCKQMDRVIDVADADNESLERVWDDMRRTVKQVTPDGGTSYFFYDDAGNLTQQVEAFGSADQLEHSFAYDSQNRILSEDTGDPICFSLGGAEIQYTYESAGSCPPGACENGAGRLVKVKTKIACDDSKGDDTFDQITYFGYDDAGRTVKETIEDDGGRNITQSYGWDKNGNPTSVTPGSGIVTTWTYGSGGSNADADRIVSLIRTVVTTNTTLISNGVWYPFGPIKEYEQANTISSNNLIARFTWDLAHRPTQLLWEQETSGTDVFKIAYTLDAQGRVTARDFTSAATGVEDAWYLYDWQDRVTCDATVAPSGGTCPTSTSDRKNSFTGSPAYTASGERQTIEHRTNGEFDADIYTYSYLPGTDQIDTVVKDSNQTGSIAFGWDGRGNRLYDDDDEWADDRRDYTYDGRNNLIAVSGKIKISATVVHDYTMVNAFDHKNRRFFKSLLDEDTGIEAQWFFYYDLHDRLIEVNYTPDISDPDDYQLVQFYWIGERPVARLQTTYEDGTQATQGRRFLHADELGTPLDAWSFPIGSGNAVHAWAYNPDAFGWGRVEVGTTQFQPLRFPGQIADDETIAWYFNTGTSAYVRARPSLRENRYRVYDPFTGSYLQTDPLVSSSWNAYAYAASSPTLSTDSTGLLDEGEGGPGPPGCEPSEPDCYEPWWGDCPFCERGGVGGGGGGGGAPDPGGGGAGGGGGGYRPPWEPEPPPDQMPPLETDPTACCAVMRTAKQLCSPCADPNHPQYWVYVPLECREAVPLIIDYPTDDETPDAACTWYEETYCIDALADLDQCCKIAGCDKL